MLISMSATGSSIPPTTAQPQLYRCVALSIFICLLVLTNLFYQSTTFTTPIRWVRIDNRNSTAGTGPSLHLSQRNNRTEYDGDLQVKVYGSNSIDYCYHPSTFDRTNFLSQNFVVDAIPQLHPQQQQLVPPNIIWLMSFPNSGTTYTLKYVQGSTLTTTATNYGGSEQVGYNNSISIDDPSNVYGPFLRYPDRPYSCSSILTKTHCHQDTVLSNNISHFMNSCRMGNRNVDGSIEEIIYDTTTRVHSAIHLIRNPFDNIVARMHYKQKQWLASNSTKDHELADYIAFTPDGLLHWCRYIQLTEQKHYISYFNATFWKSYMEPVPCAIEFYKYFHWHHFTTEGIRSTIHNPSMVLYYEEYTTQYNTTTNQILQFLQLQRSSHGMPPEFIVGKTYTDWFTKDMKDSVKQLALFVVSNPTWKLLRHYFE